jgi:hypothetical protein
MGGKAAKLAVEARANASRSKEFTLKELDWFSQNAYNCAVNACENWEPQPVISITDSCLKVSSPLPPTFFNPFSPFYVVILDSKRAFCSFFRCIRMIWIWKLVELYFQEN